MDILIYSKPSCPQCDMAKNYLNARLIPYKETVFDVGQEKRPNVAYISIADFKQTYPNVSSAPFIVIDGVGVGGYQDLMRWLTQQQ